MSTSRPNILLMIADDLGYADLSCFGGDPIETPHIDSLAESGVKCTDFYAGAPVCSPSRAALLTGRNHNRDGIYNYIPPRSIMHLSPDTPNLPRLLKTAGYRTGHFGKWHLSSSIEDNDLPAPQDFGFDYSFGVANNAKPSHRNPENFVRNREPLGPLEGYSCQLVADEFIQWEERTRDEQKPFFACVWFNEPHRKVAAPPDLVDKYTRPDDEDPERGVYLGCIENMDRQVGKILEQLQDRGLAQNTIVLFSSDNGSVWQASSGPLRGKKSHLWEGGIRVPTLVRWPGLTAAGKVIDTPMGFVDILPTLCSTLNMPVPDSSIDGIDCRPGLGGEKLERDKPLFWVFPRHELLLAARAGNIKMVGERIGNPPEKPAFDCDQMRFVKQVQCGDPAFYDLAADIGETVRADPSQVPPDLAPRVERLFREVMAQGPNWYPDKPE